MRAVDKVQNTLHINTQTHPRVQRGQTEQLSGFLSVFCIVRRQIQGITRFGAFPFL